MKDHSLFCFLIAFIIIVSAYRITDQSAKSTSMNNIIGANKSHSGNIGNDHDLLCSLSSNKNSYLVNETIFVTGYIKNNSMPLINHTIIVHVLRDNLTIYKTSIMTNREGKFNLSFRIPLDGIMRINSELAGEDSERGALITVLVKMYDPLIMILEMSVIVTLIIIGLLLKIKVKIKEESEALIEPYSSACQNTYKRVNGCICRLQANTKN